MVLIDNTNIHGVFKTGDTVKRQNEGGIYDNSSEQK